MKNHLKRIASPRGWQLSRRENTFVVRPNPGAHSLEKGLSLGFILRDLLKIVPIINEVKKMLNNQEVLIDGKRRKDHRFIVGLFDVLTLPALKKHYRMLLDRKGRLVLVEIPAADSSFKPGKIIGKKLLPGKKIQYNLYDGRNVISDQEAKVGDSFALHLPSQKIKEVLPLAPGAMVFLIKGKHSGELGRLKEVRGKEAVYNVEGKEVETARKYLFVVGKKEPFIQLRDNPGVN